MLWHVPDTCIKITHRAARAEVPPFRNDFESNPTPQSSMIKFLIRGYLAAVFFPAVFPLGTTQFATAQDAAAGDAADQNVESGRDSAAKPHIVMCFADDWGAYASAYGKLQPGGPSDALQTPNFDAIAGQGVLFTNAFVSAPS